MAPGSCRTPEGRGGGAAAPAGSGALPGIRMADKMLEGVTAIRLDASVVTCHSDKEGAEPNFKGFGLHPLLAYCDNTAEPLAGTLRPGSAGSNTAADHLAVLDAAITALPPGFRRRLMVTCDGAGASHALIARLDRRPAPPGYQVIYSVGWELGKRERAAIDAVPARGWQIAVDEHGEGRERRPDPARRRPGRPPPPVLDRRSARRRADWPAARRAGRGPARRLARQDADLRTPRAPASRRPAHLVRSRSRLGVDPGG